MSSYSIVEEVQKAIQGEAYIAALGLALTIPDMCCGANSTSGDYVDWFDTYVNHKFLKGTECYALRCSFLHQQTGDINGQRVLRDKELWFTLNVPRNNNSIRVQLYIDDIDKFIFNFLFFFIIDIFYSSLYFSWTDSFLKIYPFQNK